MSCPQLARRIKSEKILFTQLFLFVLFRIELENAYIDEKEDACHALGELAENIGYATFPLFSFPVLRPSANTHNVTPVELLVVLVDAGLLFFHMWRKHTRK